MEGEDFAELVGSIYDAALDLRVWPVMLNCLAIRCRQSAAKSEFNFAYRRARNDHTARRSGILARLYRILGKPQLLEDQWEALVARAREGILDSNILCAPAAAGNNE